MADRRTIARPYARAAFEEARGDNRLGEWSQAINTGAVVVKDPRVQSLLGNPRVAAGELAQLVTDVAGNGLDQDGRNFIQTLAENRRLAYLPEIAALFDELKAAEEGIVEVTVTAAAPLDEQQKLALAEALSRKLKRQVRLQCETDARLIGGAVLRAGDLVIDGSLRTRLERIAYELTA